jgi:hypothetical protein
MNAFDFLGLWFLMQFWFTLSRPSLHIHHFSDEFFSVLDSYVYFVFLYYLSMLSEIL